MKTISVMLLLIVAAPVLEVRAQDLSSEVAELRQLLVEMQDDYQSRISDLEVRLERAERLAIADFARLGQALVLAGLLET